jgi:hypothetical protein
MDNEYLHQRMLKQYGGEYTEFLWTDFKGSSKLCPYCKTDTLRRLWIGDHGRVIDGKVWAKWYKWCESCLRGIYCPLGTYSVPEGEPYINWGDQEALRQALPAGLKLIKPVRALDKAPS